MKRTLLLILIYFAFIQLAVAQLTPEITSWKINTTGQTGYAGILADVQTVQYSTNNVYVSCTGIPGYTIGPWPSNPNMASNQNFVFKITRNPQKNTGTLTTVGLGHTGVWSNGVTMFNVSDAQSYNNQNVWFRNAFYWEGPGMDNCHGHPQQQGEYHHHMSPHCLYNSADSLNHSPIIGYAFDGFPIYGAYSYTDTAGTGAIIRMTSSYRLRNITDRTTLPDGTALSPSQYGPAINSTYPLGCYIQDYEYVQGLGTLDIRNGRFCVTHEYPSGTYAYFVTIDAAENPIFPYTMYDTYYGIVQAGNTGAGSGHNTISETTTVYTPTGVSQASGKIKFELTPNPVLTYAHIYFDPESDNNITLKIYNSEGRLVETLQNMQPGLRYTLDFTNYSTGLYLLNFDTGKNHFTQKLLKN